MLLQKKALQKKALQKKALDFCLENQSCDRRNKKVDFGIAPLKVPNVDAWNSVNTHRFDVWFFCESSRTFYSAVWLGTTISVFGKKSHRFTTYCKPELVVAVTRK